MPVQIRETFAENTKFEYAYDGLVTRTTDLRDTVKLVRKDALDRVVEVVDNDRGTPRVAIGYEYYGYGTHGVSYESWNGIMLYYGGGQLIGTGTLCGSYATAFNAGGVYAGGVRGDAVGSMLLGSQQVSGNLGVHEGAVAKADSITDSLMDSGYGRIPEPAPLQPIGMRIAASRPGQWVLQHLAKIANFFRIRIDMAGIEAIRRGRAIENLVASTRQLQSKYKHAIDFGVSGKWDSGAADKFLRAIIEHMRSPNVMIIKGTYHRIPVVHFLDPNTGLNLILSRSWHFVSGWRLNPEQLRNVLIHGGL